jgi:hypothetical protein
VRLKRFYSSREVAVMTGLTARQLQWWDARRLFVPAIGSRRTEAGGFTERRYTPMDVLELEVLADLRRRGLSIPQLRRLLDALRGLFGVRLYEAIGEGGPVTLLIAGDRLYARATDGRLVDMDRPSEPLLVDGDTLRLRPLAPRRRRPHYRSVATPRSEIGKIFSRSSAGLGITCTPMSSPTRRAAEAPASVAALTEPTSPRMRAVTRPASTF